MLRFCVSKILSLHLWSWKGASLPCFDELFRRNLRTSPGQAVMVLVLVDVWLQSVKNEEASTGRQIIVEYFDATSVTRGHSKTFKVSRICSFLLFYFLAVSLKLRFDWIMLVQIDRRYRLNNSETPSIACVKHPNLDFSSTNAQQQQACLPGIKTRHLNVGLQCEDEEPSRD